VAARTRHTVLGWHRWAIAAAIFGWLLFMLSQRMVADLDMFHEMALIREAMEVGHIPREDSYAYTPTVSPVVHHEWATGAVLYFVAVGAGLGGTGILLLRLLLVAGVVLCCYWCARRRGADHVMFVALAPVALALMVPGLSPVRAQLFTFFFLGCLLVFLELDREEQRSWPVLWLPLYAVWLNMHGGFVVAAGLYAVHAAERFGVIFHKSRNVRDALGSTWHLVATGLAMAVLPILNPYGLEYLPYLWSALTLDRPLVAEWAPLWDPRVLPATVLIYCVSLLLLVYAVVQVRDVRRLPGLLILGVTAVFAARSQRILPIYAIAWISYVPGYLAGSGLTSLIEVQWRKYMTPLATAALFAAVVFTSNAVRNRFWQLQVPNVPTHLDVYYPVGVADYLATHDFSGNLMTPFEAGAFISWKLYPQVRVGMDSRYEVAYTAEASHYNDVLYRGQAGWREVLDMYATEAILVPTRSGLHPLLSGESEGGVLSWERVYQDDGFAIFARPGVAARLPVINREGESIVGSFP
jgi:hypothetical protein